jgi:outer membrane protein assembly factor BamA
VSFIRISFVLLLSLAAFAQKPDTRRFPLERINVNGSHRYSEQAITAAMGLRPGQQTSQAELEQVSAKLGNSGLFQLVEFRFGWGTKGVVATFNVTDSTKLVPIGFENLVWFSRNELASMIKQKLPLFTGVVPLAGDYKDQIATALQQIVAEHKLNGTVVALPQGAAGQIEAMLYRVEGNEIKVTECQFPGADHANKLELQELTKYIMGMKYDKSFVDSALQTRLKDIYESDGYLAATFTQPELKIASSTPDRTDIALTTSVTEGPQYRVSGVEWSGNTVYPAQELTKSLNFAPGQIASVAKLRNALTSVRKLYSRQGYMGVNFDMAPKLSPDGTAAINLKVTEGPQYAMGSVQFSGLDQATISKLMADWKQKPGDVYDAYYPHVFMMHFAQYAQNRKYEWRNRELIHDDTRVVDIIIEVQFKGSAS